MRRIDDETRKAIAEVAAEIEAEGYEVNRRALARAFDVSPQTVARILDGPFARRGSESVLPQSAGQPVKLWAGLLIVAAIVAWTLRRR
jgi:hypothetical protein